MKPSLEREQRLFDALKRIASYLPPERLRRAAEQEYGLEYDEALEMAYDNILIEARTAVRGLRRPAAPPTPPPAPEERTETS